MVPRIRKPSRQVLSLLNDPSGRGVIGRFDLCDGQRQFERVDAEFGLDFETIRQHRKRFDETPREYPVAGKDILEGLAEHRSQKAGQHPVAGAMAGPIGGLGLVDAKAHHHVEMI